MKGEKILKTLGILGGMGPLATAYLFQKIVLLTQAGCDQQNIKAIIYNNTLIPDRTEYLVNSGENPVNALIDSAVKLQAMGADFLIMPCNTAHYFYDEMIKYINIPFIHMIKETAVFIKNTYPNEKRFGLLATEGVYKTEIYDKVFMKEYPVEIVKPSEKNQRYLMQLIYDIKKGNSHVKLDGYHEAVIELQKKGVTVFILGCTELSVDYDHFDLKSNYVDPMEILALKAITFAGKNIRSASSHVFN